MGTRLGLVLVALVGAAGCGGSLFTGTTTTDAVKWGNRGIALGQCIQEAVETPNPEAASQACVTQWLPELPPGATTVAADLARCVRVIWQSAATLPQPDRRASRIQGAANCAAQYGPSLFAAVQDAG